jgi:two-component system catabolic regulation response regulator CreB
VVNAPAAVFLVDDEAAIAEAVSFALQAEGFRCRHFMTGGECIAALAGERPALVLLDIGLPDGNGFDFFRRIREHSDVPVVFLTARREEIDRVVGLEMGADDYVVKPFSLRELMARVRMVIRRSAEPAAARGAAAGAAASTAPGAVVSAVAGTGGGGAAQVTGRFRHDLLRRQIHFGGTPLNLTLHEYRLLEVLLRHVGRVFTRAQLLDQAWEAPDHRLDRTIDSHIKSLRAKLRAVDANADPIHTHRGMGYSLEIEP